MRHKNVLDKFFYNKNKRDILYIHLMAIFLVGFVIFYFIYPLSSAFKNNQEKIYNRNIQVLDNLKVKKNVYLAQIVSLTKTIKKNSLIKNSLYKQKLFFDDLISLLDFAEFNKYKWAEFLKNIVQDAKNEGLKLISFENYFYNNDKNVTFIY
jgi:hypothetical protein